MDRNVLAVIGGTGLYEIEGLTEVEEVRVETPFGTPSDAVVRGRLGPSTMLFLPRHGRGHGTAPHQINFRANVCAVKKLGATHLVSVSAVGSMKEHIAPGDFVVVDQFLDRTSGRASTFFEDGLVAHVGFADPVCEHLALAVASAAERVRAGHAGGPGGRVHRGGVYVCIDGPQFSSRAESELYRSWGVSVIGMTAMPEAKLAREAELPYALLALATDYDCWQKTGAVLSAEAIVAVLRQNVSAARSILAELARALPDPSTSRATGALASAFMTAPALASPQVRARLGWLIDRYIGDGPSGGKRGQSA
jgi:5'-methylthioadenosine phosphorylase